MRNAVGSVQSTALFGATSDIGLAITRALAARGCHRVVLAGRDVEAGKQAGQTLVDAGVHDVRVVEWDATLAGTHEAVVDDVFSGDDVDLVLFAAGALGEQTDFDRHPAAGADLVVTNFAGAVSTLLAAAVHIRRQGHGTIVVLSSVAGERTRRSNYVYGSTKAGLDAFAQGLGDALAPDGGQVVIVRPGFVRSKMTHGRPDAPMATTPEAVADAVVRALARGDEIAWVPSRFRWVMMGLRHLPRPLWRRVSAEM